MSSRLASEDASTKGRETDHLVRGERRSRLFRLLSASLKIGEKEPDSCEMIPVSIFEIYQQQMNPHQSAAPSLYRADNKGGVIGFIPCRAQTRARQFGCYVKQDHMHLLAAAFLLLENHNDHPSS